MTMWRTWVIPELVEPTSLRLVDTFVTYVLPGGAFDGKTGSCSVKSSALLERLTSENLRLLSSGPTCLASFQGENVNVLIRYKYITW